MTLSLEFTTIDLRVTKLDASLCFPGVMVAAETCICCGVIAPDAETFIGKTTEHGRRRKVLADDRDRCSSTAAIGIWVGCGRLECNLGVQGD